MKGMMKMGGMRTGMPARSNAGGAMRGADRAAAVKAMNVAKKPAAMAKGGAVPGKKMAAKAMAKGKKMLPAFMKKGMK
jgi:hypothetical protein